MVHHILLQCKFFLVEWLNITNTVIPNPFRKYYLRIFGIRVGRASSIHRGCRFFHVGKLSIGDNSTVNYGCYLDNRRGIYIGNNVGIAHNTKIYTLGHDYNDPGFFTKGSPVYVEDNAFNYAGCHYREGCCSFGWKCCYQERRTVDCCWRKSGTKNKRPKS